MELQVDNGNEVVVTGAKELASWNRVRSNEELQTFIKNRQAEVGILDLELDLDEAAA
jgi:hypothetical protein